MLKHPLSIWDGLVNEAGQCGLTPIGIGHLVRCLTWAPRPGALQTDQVSGSNGSYTAHAHGGLRHRPKQSRAKRSMGDISILLR